LNRKQALEWANKIIREDCVPVLRRRFLLKELADATPEIIESVKSTLADRAEDKFLPAVMDFEVCLEFDRRNKSLLVYATDPEVMDEGDIINLN
jgi:hypothetical protein